MKYKEELLLQELALKIVYSWDSIQDYSGWCKEKELAKWRVEVYDYIIDSTTSKEELDYVLLYLYDNGPAKCYLEVNELVASYRIENNKSSIMDYIGNLFRRRINAEKICTNNPIYVRGDSNVDSSTRPSSSNQ